MGRKWNNIKDKKASKDANTSRKAWESFERKRKKAAKKSKKK